MWRASVKSKSAWKLTPLEMFERALRSTPVEERRRQNFLGNTGFWCSHNKELSWSYGEPRGSGQPVELLHCGMSCSSLYSHVHPQRRGGDAGKVSIQWVMGCKFSLQNHWQPEEWGLQFWSEGIGGFDVASLELSPGVTQIHFLHLSSGSHHCTHHFLPLLLSSLDFPLFGW